MGKMPPNVVCFVSQSYIVDFKLAFFTAKWYITEAVFQHVTHMKEYKLTSEFEPEASLKNKYWAYF